MGPRVLPFPRHELPQWCNRWGVRDSGHFVSHASSTPLEIIIDDPCGEPSLLSSAYHQIFSSFSASRFFRTLRSDRLLFKSEPGDAGTSILIWLSLNLMKRLVVIAITAVGIAAQLQG